ncbi:replication initiation protein [Persicobacter psychrovividus]|uniref:Initiator Rep protein WH1 domain-containing protein n=1 Tax=Persicobacter psychrovividus TaxID=387638 RepID=A0ABM7VMZ0_9BACT|nr:hypothetical protein PEPS_46660 [Persicobacter psychrovividus]
MSIIPSEYKNYRIVKGNKLVNAKEKLTAVQHRIIALMSAKITKEDTNFNEVEIKIKHILGIAAGEKVGGGYKRVREAAEGLGRVALEVEDDEGNWKVYSLITVAEGNVREDFITVKFSDEMKPFFLQLNGNYTQYMLGNVYHFQSAYSFRVYELLRQYYPKITQRTFEYNHLRELLGLEPKRYARFDNFKANVLNVSQREINQYSDMEIDFTLERSNKKVVKIHYTMKQNKKAISEAEVVESTIAKPSQEDNMVQKPMLDALASKDKSFPDWFNQTYAENMIKEYGADYLQFCIA